jgi:hypothetical protein
MSAEIEMAYAVLSRAEAHLARGLELVQDARGLIMSHLPDTIEDNDRS